MPPFCGQKEHRQKEAQKFPQPPDQAAEVVADRGEDGVIEVAVAVGEIVAAHSVVFLEMANDGLNGGAASHLSLYLRGHPPLLLGCIDF